MATQVNGNQMGGVVPIQIPQDGQPGAYGVSMPVTGQFQPQQVQPVGQQVLNGNAGYSYSLDQLPPAPQPQGQQPFMGAQGNFGLTPQWNQQGGQQFPQQSPYGQPQGQINQQPGFAQSAQANWQSQPQQGSYGQQQGQPGGNWQGQPQPAQQGQVPQLGLNTRLEGPGVPPALRGRTVGEAMALYSALETNWAQRNGIAQTPAQQSLAQMQQPQGQQQVQGQQTQAGGQGQQANPWTNPEQFFGGLLERKLEERLGPVIQHTQQQAVTQAYTIAKGGVVDFAQLEPDLMQMLAGADPATLANPATWIGAADIVRGRQMREGRYRPPAPNQLGVAQVQIPGQQMPSWQGQQANPAMMGAVPAGGQVPAYGFFTESPTAPSVSQFGGNTLPAQPTAQDYQMAEKFRMPIQDWMQWKVGVQAGQQPGQQQFGFAQGGFR